MRKRSQRTQLIGIVVLLSTLLCILVVVALLLGQNKEKDNPLGHVPTDPRDNNPMGTLPFGTSAETSASENLGEKPETLDVTTENSKEEGTPNNTEPTGSGNIDMEATQPQPTETKQTTTENVEDKGKVPTEITETETTTPVEETEAETTQDQSNDLGEF